MRAPIGQIVPAAGYALVVLAGAAVLGLVVAPWLAFTTGMIPIEADARAAFSWLVLRGFPWILGLSVASAIVCDATSARPLPVRAGVLVANVVAVWLVGSALALARLG